MRYFMGLGSSVRPLYYGEPAPLGFYGTSTTGACQNAAFWPAGSSTVTWQLYSPGGSLPSERLKLQGHGLQLVVQPSVTASGGVSKPCVAAVESHKGDQRLGGGRSRLVGLQVDVHVAALAEHARHAGNQLLPVLEPAD